MVRSLALLAFRVILGGIFAVHGYPKLFGGPGRPVHPIAARYLGAGFGQSMEHGGVSSFAAALRGLEVPFPDLMARVVALVEFLGGILIAVGWWTRPAALLLVADMAVAIRKVHWRNGLLGPGGFELPLALLGGCLGLIGAGPGDLSVDGLLQKKRRLERKKRSTDAALATIAGVAVAARLLFAGIRRAVRAKIASTARLEGEMRAVP